MAAGAPGERLGEQELAELFGVSRTLVREALMQLQARGFIEVRTRKGWYVVEPSIEEARDAFSARRIIETGILRETGRPLQSVVRKLRQHIAQEQQAIEGADAATRAFLLADFHVCLAECLGQRLLCDVLRDLTARTTLAASLYQSKHDAGESCTQHAGIVAALEKGQLELARQRMLEHIGSVEAALGSSAPEASPTSERLRAGAVAGGAPPLAQVRLTALRPWAASPTSAGRNRPAGTPRRPGPCPAPAWAREKYLKKQGVPKRPADGTPFALEHKRARPRDAAVGTNPEPKPLRQPGATMSKRNVEIVHRNSMALRRIRISRRTTSPERSRAKGTAPSGT